MKIVKFVRKEQNKLIKVYTNSNHLDIARFSINIIYDSIKNLGDVLDIQFDEVEIYPRTQPREKQRYRILPQSEKIKN